jgi:hypothetical protein
MAPASKPMKANMFDGLAKLPVFGADTLIGT